MTTPGDLINEAFFSSGIIGTGQQASGQDINNALKILNMMIAQWNRKRYLIYALQDLSIVSTGQISYSIGAGGDFDTIRPDRLEDGCYLRMLNTGSTEPVDYPLQLVQSHEDYSKITIKNMGTFPNCVFYDSQYPLGFVYAWPVPQAATYELHIMIKQAIAPFISLAEQIILPPEYEAAIYYNMQVRLRSAYRLPADPVIIGLATDALNVLRESNSQIPTMSFPRAVLGRGRGYNIYSDT